MNCISCGVPIDNETAIDLQNADFITMNENEESHMQSAVLDEPGHSLVCEDCFYRLKGE